ncbi:MAG: pyridoxamine 5'-phosphate oxidase family protein [Anaerolineales bacterium]|nr:pyridoxamine 5'-phosphate oxidase family protein [Anaerolineales bacterium]
MTALDTRAAVAAFLACHSTLTLATLSPAGELMAASLFYASDDELRLYWTSGASSRHSRNLAHKARVAVTIHGETWRWNDIAGVQMEGETAILPAGPAWQAAWALYRAKFPFVDEFQAEVSRSNFYVLTPRWARLIDNSQGFGHKVELRPGS